MKTKAIVYWIRSSRGTESTQPVEVPYNYGSKEIEPYLESWCSGFGAWHVSENIVTYGWANYGLKARRVYFKYKEAKEKRLRKMDDLIAKKITPKQFNAWLKKNKKALTFPFK